MYIVREVDGVNHTFKLTWEEEQRFNKEQDIQFAKNIIENYDDGVGSVDQSVYENDSLLCDIANEITERSMEDNGEIEYNVLKKYGVIVEE